MIFVRLTISLKSFHCVVITTMAATSTINLNITGGGSTYDITQSGVKDNTVDATFSGDSQDVDITQSD